VADGKVRGEPHFLALLAGGIIFSERESVLPSLQQRRGRCVPSCEPLCAQPPFVIRPLVCELLCGLVWIRRVAMQQNGLRGEARYE
jgi:hypothetical protein